MSKRHRTTGRRRTGRYTPPSRKNLDAIALADARRLGCICLKPDVTVRHTAEREVHVHVEHDDNCPLSTDHRRTIGITFGGQA